MTKDLIILGAGITGLTAGIKTGAPIYEAGPFPGGVCRFYRKNGYLFGIGGGHWIFGRDTTALNFLRSFSPLKKYRRNSAVYFPDKNLYVPYPLQYHLSYLPKEIRDKAIEEIKESKKNRPSGNATFAHWLAFNFGPTLCNFFFFPFHELYTAGLYTKIAPQDYAKTPRNIKLILKGAKRKQITKVGYNRTFFYPKEGLSYLVEKMAQKCKIHFHKRVVEINVKKKNILFADGTGIKYRKIISTLPLNKTVRMAKIALGETPPPYTSVLVINIGAKKGDRCPLYHWLYIPQSKSGFFRVGFYSHVDSCFLPPEKRGRVSLYVDKAFLGGRKLEKQAVKKLCAGVIGELREWGFIKETEVVDSTWVDVAYTWLSPSSRWREKALRLLMENGIYQIGRFGKWRFQGIIDSIKEGLATMS